MIETNNEYTVVFWAKKVDLKWRKKVKVVSDSLKRIVHENWNPKIGSDHFGLKQEKNLYTAEILRRTIKP